jgi:hypothetical protein
MARIRTERAIAEDAAADELRAAGEAETADAEAFRAAREGRAFSPAPGAMSVDPGLMSPAPVAAPMPAPGGPVNLWDAIAPPAAPDPAAEAERALWERAAAIPALGSGSIDLPGAPLTSSGAGGHVAPGFPAPGAGHPLGPSFGAAAAPAVVTPEMVSPPAPRGARGGGGRAGGATPAPLTEEEVNAQLIEELTRRPVNDPSLFGVIDNRTESGLDRDLRLNDDARTIEQRRAELRAMAAADEMDRVEGEMTARRELETQRRDAMGAARESYRRFADRASSLSIDPDGFYSRGGGGARIASMIAIGLGGLSSAISGGPNAALEMINDEIDRDLMAQQQRIDSAFRRADAEGTLFDMARQEFGDRGAALDASRALALENAAAQVAAAEAGLGSVEARHNAEVMAAELRSRAAAAAADAERAQTEWELQMRLLDARGRRQAAEAARAERRAMAGPGGPARPEPITADQIGVYNRVYATNGGNREAAAAAAGIDVSMAPASGLFAEPTGGPEAVNDAELSTALTRLETLIPSDPEADIPGIGATGWLPPGLLTDEGRALREEAENVIDLLGRSRTGANMPPTELATYERLLLGSPQTDAGIRRGVSRMRDLIEGRTRRTREGRTMDEVDSSALSGAVPVD